LIDHPVSGFNIDELKCIKVHKITDITILEAGATHFLALK